ncbi:MAG: hypothetical protein IJW59_05030 [Clostridia bacterium]|nr:hypothetical protein [Clostridia bacterium]
MRDTITFTTQIPVDEEGYIELQCQHCNSRFRMHREIWEEGTNDKLFCPSCGIPSKIQSFLTKEVVDNYQTQVSNYINNTIEQLFSGFKNTKYIKFNHKPIKNKQEHQILFIEKDVYLSRCSTCGQIVKIKEIDKIAGFYCPICGDENE